MKTKSIIEFILLLCLSICSCLAAAICGWCGLMAGRIIESFSFIPPFSIGCFYAFQIFSRNINYSNKPLFSAACACTFFLCSYLFYHQFPFLYFFEKRLKGQNIDVYAIQDWAIKLLEKEKRGDRLIDPFSYPKSVAEIKPGNFLVFLINDDNMGDDGYIKIFWGSGVVGQWGIIAGKPTLMKEGNFLAKGVYFFVNPQPAGWTN